MKLETMNKPWAIELSTEGLEKATEAQRKVLKANVISLEQGDEAINDYHGCGCGWAEIDKDGKITKMRYFNDEVMNYLWDGSSLILGRAKLHYSLTRGSKEQNVKMVDFEKKTENTKAVFMKNGNVRFAVNFSATQLCRF